MPTLRPRPAAAIAVVPKQSKVKKSVVKKRVSKKNKTMSVSEIPDVTLQDDENNKVNLKELTAGGKVVVLFSYPKADTPGCTKQSCAYGTAYADWNEKKLSVYGISSDTVEAQHKFREKFHMPFPLLSDPEQLIVGPLGAAGDGPKKVKRSYFILKDGKVVVNKVGVTPDSVQESLDEAAKLAKQ